MDITELRNKIDEVDRQIAPLLKKRFELAGEVARYKQENGMAICDADREKEVRLQVSALIGAPYDVYVNPIYASIMDACKEYQRSLSE